MKRSKRWKSLIPNGFLWRLTILNTLVIALAIAVSSWALYHTACFLVDGMNHLSPEAQEQFKGTLLQYLWVFILISIIVASVCHFYFIKRLIQPISQLIESTKQMKQGKYPEPIHVSTQDEVAELVQQYNGLITLLEKNELHRQKLVSDLSHEFRTPLANLNGYLKALENGVIEGDQSLYASLYQESDRLTTMVKRLEQLKEWEHISAQTITKKAYVSIQEQIERAVEMFKWKLTEANIPIEMHIEEKKLMIYSEGIQQVLNNLLDNAIRYYTGRGSIQVKGEICQEVYRITVCGPSQPIPETEKSNLFDRFYRLESSRSRETGGTGLGLAIAKEIIAKHHGEIGVTACNETNAFWFTLPYNGIERK